MAPDPRPELPSAEAWAALRRDLTGYFRGRAPAADVDDLVQLTLARALEADSAPAAWEERRRWVFGIARHKLADFHRGRSRSDGAASDEPVDGGPLPDAPVEADALLRWAERELPPDDPRARATLDWMLREGDGEKLERIAQEEGVAPTQVRQRVSRLRRLLRGRWQLQAAALGTVLLVAGLAWVLVRREPERAHGPELAPEDVVQRGREARERALHDCAEGRWRDCLDGLDRARRADPAGDAAPAVGVARERARAALAPAPSASTEAPPAPILPRAVPTADDRAPPTPAPAPRPAPKPGPVSTERAKPAPAPTAPRSKNATAEDKGSFDGRIDSDRK